jgi:hypothetical protein
MLQAKASKHRDSTTANSTTINHQRRATYVVFGTKTKRRRIDQRGRAREAEKQEQ